LDLDVEDIDEDFGFMKKPEKKGLLREGWGGHRRRADGEM
jgi:hypothetical protein